MQPNPTQHARGDGGMMKYKFWWADGSTSIYEGIDETDALDSNGRGGDVDKYEYCEEVES